VAANNGPQDYHAAPVSLIIGLFGAAVMFILWWANHRWMVEIWLWVEWALLQPIKYTVGFLSDFSPRLSDNIIDTFTAWRSCPKVTADPNAVQEGTLTMCHNYKQNWNLGWWVSTRIGEYWRWPLLGIIGFLIFRLWKNPLKKYRGNMTVSNFLKEQSKSWKAIAPFLHRDLVNDEKPDYQISVDATNLAIREKVVVAKTFLEKEAKRVLRKQLGKEFSRDAFSEIEKALFVCFGYRIMRNPKESKRLFDSINESMRGGKPANLGFATKKFDEVFENPDVKRVVDGHQFVSTALFQMLVRACKTDGTLPPNEFLAWVKPGARSLWYALNRAPADDRLDIASYSEGHQIVCQWQAEMVAKNKNMMVTGVFYDRAIMAWKESLYKTGAIDEECKNINAAALQKEKEMEAAERAERERSSRRDRSRF